MAIAKRKPVIITDDEEYGVGDLAILELKTGEVFVGVIKGIRFSGDSDAVVDLYLYNQPRILHIDSKLIVD